VQLEGKDSHIEVLTRLVQAAEDQTADAMQLVSVMKHRKAIEES
jgi:hypothetical protein